MKAKKDHSIELERLKDYSTSILDFMSEIPRRVDLVTGPSYYNAFKSIIEQLYLEKDIRGMRVIANECIAWAKDMSKANADKLNSLLIEKFGEGLNDGWKAKRVNGIISKKKIKSIQEYALLKEYLEEILSDPEKKSKTDEVENILVEYQRKTGVI